MENLDAVVPIRSPVIEEPISIAEVGELGRKLRRATDGGGARSNHSELCCRASRDGGRGGCLYSSNGADEQDNLYEICVIGRDQRLRRIEGMLPPGFSIIYEAS